MENLFAQFDEGVNLEELQNEIENAGDNFGEFEPVPHGDYEVKIVKMELVTTKKKPARPMLTVQFRVLSGEKKGSIIFMNQVLTHAFAIHLMLEFLKSLETNVDVKFESYTQFAELVLDVYDDIEGRLEYLLIYEETDKGFDKFTIHDVFEVE